MTSATGKLEERLAKIESSSSAAATPTKEEEKPVVDVTDEEVGKRAFEQMKQAAKDHVLGDTTTEQAEPGMMF